MRLTKILCFFMVFWLISAAIKASYIQKGENRDTSHIQKLSIQKALELYKSTLFQSRVLKALEFLMPWLDEQLWIHTQTKAVKQRANYFCFHLGSLHIIILRSNHNKTHNAITFDHFQKGPLHYQNLWKKSTGKGVNGESYLPVPQSKCLLQSEWFIFKCHLLFSYFYFFLNA